MTRMRETVAASQSVCCDERNWLLRTAMPRRLTLPATASPRGRRSSLRALLLLSLLCSATASKFELFHENRLLGTVLGSGYNKVIRPNGTTVVDFSVVLNQIVSMEEIEQTVVCNIFIDQKWHDPRLAWNPAEYDGISNIRLPANEIWLPDTFIYNIADQHGFLQPKSMGNVVAYSDGTVFWPNPFARLKTRCRMDIARFPYDEQHCMLNFGSWSQDSLLVTYRMEQEKPDLSLYQENNEWLLISFDGEVNEVFYGNWIDPVTFTEINYSIRIRRKPLHILFNIVVPCLLLSSLTLVSFGVPFQQQIHLCISTFLSYSVFTLLVANMVPAQSDSVPLISVYLALTMAFTLCGMCWFAFVNRLRLRANKESPVIKCILFYLGRPCCDKKRRPPISSRFVRLEVASDTPELQPLNGKDGSLTATAAAAVQFDGDAWERHVVSLNRHMFGVYFTFYLTCNSLMWVILPRVAFI